MAQEPLFAPEAAAVAGELRAGAAADDAVAGDDDGDGVAAVGGADGAHGLGVVDGVGDGLVAGGVAVADAEKLLPDLALERGAVQGQGQIEAAQVTGEIGGQLALHFLQQRMRAWRHRG